MIADSLSLDLALKSTWDRYYEVLQYPENYDQQEVGAFLDGLSGKEEVFLGYGTMFLVYKAAWLAQAGRDAEAIEALEMSLRFGHSSLYSIWGDPPTDRMSEILGKERKETWLRYRLHTFPKVSDWLVQVKKTIMQGWSEQTFGSCFPLRWLERMPLPVKSIMDHFNPKTHGGYYKKTLQKGDDVYMYRRYLCIHTALTTKAAFLPPWSRLRLQKAHLSTETST